MRHAAAIVLSLFFLPACTQLDTVLGATSGSIASVAPDTVNAAKQALTAAHQLHKVTADFLTIAATTNLCHAVCASTAKTFLDQSEAALVAADTAIKLGDAVGVEAKISVATTLISQTQALFGKK